MSKIYDRLTNYHLDDSDTDGDGLLDGEEINPTPIRHIIPNFAIDTTIYGPLPPEEAYCFVAQSDPTVVDSDGDGICDGDADALKNGRYNDDMPMYKNNVDIPTYFKASIEISGLLDEDDRLRGELATILSQSDSRVTCATCIYQIEGHTYTCQYNFILADERLANRALNNLICNYDYSNNFNRFLYDLDLFNEALGDPSLIGLPQPFSIVSSVYSFAQTMGWVNTQDTEIFEKRIALFRNIYQQADGKTPLCMNGILCGRGYFSQWVEIRKYNRTY